MVCVLGNLEEVRRRFRRGAVAWSIGKHLLWFVATLGISVASYGLFAWVRTGQIPSLESYSRYQRIFYGSGFWMIPMNPFECWQPVILVYLATIFYCLRQLWRRRATNTCSWYLFIALYGLGIFTYYHWNNSNGRKSGF